jgi:hypothetical protein
VCKIGCFEGNLYWGEFYCKIWREALACPAVGNKNNFSYA